MGISWENMGEYLVTRLAGKYWQIPDENGGFEKVLAGKIHHTGFSLATFEDFEVSEGTPWGKHKIACGKSLVSIYK